MKIFSLQNRRNSLVTLSLVGVGALLFASALVSTQSSAATKSVAKPTPSAKPSLGGARPMVAGGAGGAGGVGGVGGVGAPDDAARAAAFQKYQDCLTATGVTLPQFAGRGFGRGGGGNNGARPTGAPTSRPTNFPTTRPSQPALTAEQQAALTKCAPLRPQFGGGFGRGGNPGGAQPGGAQPGGSRPSSGTIVKKNGVTPPNPATKPSTKSATNSATNSAKKPTGKPVAPTNVAGASYIACLNKNGVNVKSASDIAGLDQQSPKIAAALKACAAKK